MIESGSSLFYLLHCSTHDRLNTMTFRSFRNIPHGLHRAFDEQTVTFDCFASAHPARIASPRFFLRHKSFCFASAHPARIASIPVDDRFRRTGLCLSTSRTDCILRQNLEAMTAPLCLSTSRTDCIVSPATFKEPVPSFASAHPARIASMGSLACLSRSFSLPQHIPHGLHPCSARCT